MLSDREKMILHFCCSMTIAKMSGVEDCNRIIEKMIGDIRRERCRSLAPEDIENLLREINEEMVSGSSMFQHLMGETIWSMTGERPNKKTNWSDMK